MNFKKLLTLTLVTAALCLLPIYASAFEGGTGEEGYPFLISTEEDLQSIVYMPDQCYKLVNNIELTQPWTPVETFSGVLDGNGYEISNLFEITETTTQSLGFICYNDGILKNLTIRTTDSFTLNCTNLQYAGILVGSNNKSITNCAVYGNLISNASKCIGGMVGCNNKQSTTRYPIYNSYAIVNVKATNSTADIGGFIGEFATWNTGDKNYQLHNCYCVGTLTGGSGKNSFGAIRNYEEIINCFYDVTVSKLNNGDGTAKTTYAMKQESTYTDWDFDSVWGIDVDYNDGYPHLLTNYNAQISAPKLSVSSAHAVIDHEFSTYISINNNPGVASFVLSLEYDTALLNPVLMEAGSAISFDQIETNIEDSPNGCIYLTFTNVSDVVDDGAIVKITFTVPSDVQLGTTYLNLGVDSIIDEEYKDLHFNLIDGEIIISDILMGDVLQDDIVDVRDALKLCQYLARKATLTASEKKAADFYPDGVIDAKDSLRLAQYLAGCENVCLGVK